MKPLKIIFALFFTVLGFFGPALAAQPASDDASVECKPRGGLPNFFSKLEAGGPVRIAYLGGSITEAAGWRVYSREWFASRYPQAQVSEIRATISGTNSEFGACRLSDHVLRYKPDLVFIEFAVNGTGGTPTRSLRTVEGLVRQIRRDDPQTEICFVFTVSSGMMPARRAGRLPQVVTGMHQVADHYGVSTVDFAPEVVRREREGRLVFSGKAPGKDAAPDAPMVFSTDGTHPLLWTGHYVYLDTLVRAMPALQAAGKRGPHALPTPLDPQNWDKAALVAVDAPGVKLSEGWSKIAPPGGTDKSQRIHTYLPGFWETSRPGTTVEFTFRGTCFGLSGFRNPAAGRFRVTIGDRPPLVSTFLDSYSYAGLISHRAWFYPDDLPPGIHRVKIEFLDGAPDRSEIKKAGGEAAAPVKDTALVLQLGAILLAGELVP